MQQPFQESVATVLDEALRELDQALDSERLDAVIYAYNGKRGRFRELQREIGTLSPEERPRAGQVLDEAIQRFVTSSSTLAAELNSAARTTNYDATFDPTVPGEPSMAGGLHPTIQMMYDLNDAFADLNFDICAGPEISSELYEFDYMNFPPDHPSRESMDTYWLRGQRSARAIDRLCIRPHLTGASVRYMQTHEPPFRFAYPGRVYRNETTDARHERAFFQYEALIVDRDITFSAGNLLTSTVLDTVFGRKVPTRMRTGFFPFVEPGFEIDMQCQVCLGKGCSTCGRVGWLEIMPGGVPHPNVLRSAGLDPEEWSGFYVNVGLDRLVMMRYGINDVRLFHGGDLRFLTQFK